MSGKKKNLVTLLSLCAILVVCLVLYFVIPKGTTKTDTANSTDAAGQNTDQDNKNSIGIDSLAADQIETVMLKKKGKKVWSLKQQEKTWILSGRENAPVDQELIKAILGNVDPVTATQKFEAKTEDLSAYGLDKPSLTICIKMRDGKEYNYDIGSEVPKSDLGYYGKKASGTELYCLDPALVKAFDVPETSLIKMDSLPEIEADYLTSISVNNQKGKNFAAKKVSDREKVDFYSNWNITAPYDKPLATSQLEWNKVLNHFTALSYEEMVEYDSRNLKKYGLQNPNSQITVKYYVPMKGYTPTVTATPNANLSVTSSKETAYVIPDEKREYKTLRLCVGKKDKESYFVCEKGKKNVYKMNADMVENMTGLDAYTNMDHCVYSVLATSIKGYDVTYGGKTLKVTRKTVSKTGTESSPSPTKAPEKEGSAVENAKDKSVKNSWTLNGKKIPEDKESEFLNPYSLAYLLEYSERADDSVKPKDKEPVLTIVYHEEKRDVTVKYLPYDGINFYRVNKNGMDYFLVDKLLVDDVIEKFKGIESMG